MNETLEKLQKEFDDDMNALDALSKQVESCQAVIEVIKKMPENNAWVVVGVGVGSEKPDAEINLRGLGCDEVAALLAVTQTTLCSLKKSIHDIQVKYPGIITGGGSETPIQKVENHYHYHFHDRPHHHGHWTPSPPPCPPDDEGVDMLPPDCGCGCQEPEQPGETPDSGSVDYDKGDEPDPDTGDEPLAYGDGGWGKTSDEYDKYKDSAIETYSGLNLG